jgi:hypothetical protein
MRVPVDYHTTRSANTLTAIVFESDWFFALGDKLFIEHVEHLEEGHVVVDVVELVRYEPAILVFASLAPNFQGEFHFHDMKDYV